MKSFSRSKMKKPREYHITAKRSGISVLKSLPQYRELFMALVRRNIVVRYKRTYLGLFWVFLQPVLLTAIFVVFMGEQMGGTVDDYPIFLYSGFTLWTIFSGGFFYGATSLVSQGQMLKKVYFPRLLMPLSYVFASLFDFLLLVVPLLFLMVFMSTPIMPIKLLLCSSVAILLSLAVSSGFSLLIAGLTIKSKDLHHAMPFVVQSLLFVSPVIYPMQLVENTYLQELLSLNPIATALDIFRAGIYDQTIDSIALLQAVGISMMIVVVGFSVFNHKEQTLADHL